MKTTTNTLSLTNYTLVNDTIQLRLNFNTEIYIQDDVKLRLVKNIIERMKEELGLSKSLIPDQVLQAVTTIFNQLRKYCKQKKIKFVYGKGKRKTKEQRDYELLKDWKEKLESYRKHLEIMGDYRNSYSKTDHDATFMRMKEDHMKNGQLKPAYNIQLASASDFIIGENISHHPSDMYTLKPFLKDLLEKYPNKLNRIVADAGYESEENYVFLAENNLTSYIKPSNYEKSKTRKYKKEQEFRKSLKYDERQDKYISQEGKEFIRCNDRYRKRKSGYVTTTKVYRCFDWNKEGQKSKGIYIAETFQKYREEFLKSIISDQGIEERINRSIQAEGAFSKIKSGLSYNRFHHRGKENIISEICLLSIALNLNKLASKIENKNLEIIKYKAAWEKIFKSIALLSAPIFKRNKKNLSRKYFKSKKHNG